MSHEDRMSLVVELQPSSEEEDADEDDDGEENDKLDFDRKNCVVLVIVD